MKVVCCKNCGAKYQLDDTDDITTFECSSCAGDLEYLEEDSNEEITAQNSFFSSDNYSNSYIVQCRECGLKYKIKSDDSILDYECDSCGGSLRYLDEEMNRELDNYLEERKKEQQQKAKKDPEAPQEEIEKPDHSLKTFADKIGEFFSEEKMQKIAEEAKKEEELKKEEEAKKARTTIPKSVLTKFGKEFALPKTEDYNILKNYLKDDFFKKVSKDYIDSEEEEDTSPGFFDKLILKEPNNGEAIPSKKDYVDKKPNEEESGLVSSLYKHVVFIIGIIIFILSIIEILTTNSGLGIIALILGLVGIIYGFYNMRKDSPQKEPEERKRIIRNHLLELSNDYYVFYNVKIPISTSNINHLVVGPTGIYALLSHKYNPKLRLESENENLSLIRLSETDDEKIEEYSFAGNIKRFRYTTKQAKFSKDNKIKQKALALGEDLINFLNDNDIRNCFVEPLVGFVNNEVVVINMPLTDEDLFIDELIHQIQNSVVKLDQETVEKCAVLINNYSADCSSEL